MAESRESTLDKQLREILGSPGKPDFDAWQNRHGDAVTYLNPIVTRTFQRRRRFLMSIGSAAAIAVVAGTAAVMITVSSPESFAQTVQSIDRAETTTWTITTYLRMHSVDGKRTWLQPEPRLEMAYRAPNMYRETRYDSEGNVRSVEIIDTRQRKWLHLDMKLKKASWKADFGSSYGPGSPFEWVAKILKSQSLELVGQREINGVTANVFRYNKDAPRTQNRVELWIDAKTKRLVRTISPGAGDDFDPETAPDRNNPAEEKYSKGEIAYSLRDNVVFDAKVDPKEFEQTPPPGFEVDHEQPKPPVTEQQLVEWLEVTARFNDGLFTDTAQGVDHEKHYAAEMKDKADRTEVEQNYLDLWTLHVQKNRHTFPVRDFAKEFTIPDTFRYLGKGVKLGAADRVVCWYKLKAGGNYRAVYGDLKVKDVDPTSLPLPVND